MMGFPAPRLIPSRLVRARLLGSKAGSQAILFWAVKANPSLAGIGTTIQPRRFPAGRWYRNSRGVRIPNSFGSAFCKQKGFDHVHQPRRIKRKFLRSMTVLGQGEDLGDGTRFPALTGEEQSLVSFHGPGFSFYRLLCNFVRAGIRAPSGTALQEADIAGSVQHPLPGKSGFDQAERRIAKISDTCLGMRLRLKIPMFPIHSARTLWLAPCAIQGQNPFRLNEWLR